jgi:hypothetical protein
MKKNKVIKEKTLSLDKTSKTNQEDVLTTENIHRISNISNISNIHSISRSNNKGNKNKKYNWKKGRKITIKKYCANYKHDSLGKQNKSLYDACKFNQYCRKNKCKDIDRKFDKIKNRKLGSNGNILLLTSLTSKCPLGLSTKTKKKCLNKATRKFYEDNNMGDIYNQVLECDKKTCAKERQIFLSNLFMANKTKKRIHQPVQVNLEDIPDNQMIETN